jgi:hypothetical protein
VTAAATKPATGCEIDEARGRVYHHDADKAAAVLALLTAEDRMGIRLANATQPFAASIGSDREIIPGAWLRFRQDAGPSAGGAWYLAVGDYWLAVEAAASVLAPPVVFVAMFPHQWGKGPTPEHAIKQARKAGGRGRDYFVKRLPNGAREVWVDDSGGIRWTWALDADPGTGTEPVKVPVVLASGKGRKAYPDAPASLRGTDGAA